MNSYNPAPPAAVPVSPADRRPPDRPARRRSVLGCLFPLVLLALFGSLLVNVLLGLFVLGDLPGAADAEDRLDEKFLLGDHGAPDKVAVVKVEGVITDASIRYPVQQLKRAAHDRHVKAVVLRVDSPGGSVTASEELYQCIVNLRDNTGRRFPGSGPKPVRVSMGGLAASGGYYIAVAGNPVAAEPTTITGSIGVFAMLPNVAELAHTHGVRVELVKAGPIKASGSFFHTLAPEERQTWQDTVDAAYDLFLDRIATGRRTTKEKLRDDVTVRGEAAVRDDKGNPKLDDKGNPLPAVPYTRTRADGGTYTAAQAKQFGLVDSVEDLPAVVRAAASAAGLTQFRAVTFDKPMGLLDLLAANQARQSAEGQALRGLGAALTPRLWYLVPSADGAVLTTNP
ncbi:MAG TPA: S49 family peptidase [Urbifossiella sp.]|jgi:protease-4|nr:S49 family peptidase [Urbifossiella sp.]